MPYPTDSYYWLMALSGFLFDPGRPSFCGGQVRARDRDQNRRSLCKGDHHSYLSPPHLCISLRVTWFCCTNANTQGRSSGPERLFTLVLFFPFIFTSGIFIYHGPPPTWTLPPPSLSPSALLPATGDDNCMHAWMDEWDYGSGRHTPRSQPRMGRDICLFQFYLFFSFYPCHMTRLSPPYVTRDTQRAQYPLLFGFFFYRPAFTASEKKKKIRC